MLPLILAPIVAELIKNGLGILASALQSKGKEVIEEKLGIELPSSIESYTPELLQQLKLKEIEHEEFLLNIGIKERELELQELAEGNRNTADARRMNSEIQGSSSSSDLAKNAAYYIDFLLIGATLLLAYFIFFVAIPANNKELAYTAFGSLLTLCGTVVNFHRGTSKSSEKHGDALHNIVKRKENL